MIWLGAFLKEEDDYEKFYFYNDVSTEECAFEYGTYSINTLYDNTRMWEQSFASSNRGEYAIIPLGNIKKLPSDFIEAQEIIRKEIPELLL